MLWWQEIINKSMARKLSKKDKPSEVSSEHEEQEPRKAGRRTESMSLEGFRESGVITQCLLLFTTN